MDRLLSGEVSVNDGPSEGLGVLHVAFNVVEAILAAIVVGTVISYFLAPPGTSTLQVEIYTAIRKGFTPEINAVSSIIIVISMGLMLAVARNYRFGGE